MDTFFGDGDVGHVDISNLETFDFSKILMRKLIIIGNKIVKGSQKITTGMGFSKKITHFRITIRTI